MPISTAPQSRPPSPSLTDVLDQSEHVKDLVEECAEELTSVNAALKHEFADHNPPPELEVALERSEAVENKVQEASEALTLVNAALENEVLERHALEQRLTAVTNEEASARHAALHDSLTGLPNRALFADRVEHGLAQARRHGWKLAVMFVDLDNFKKINDAYGHDTGDVILKTIAQRLRQATRADDTVCRHGGDEFLYLLMEIQDESDIKAIARKIQAAIEAPCEVDAGCGVTHLQVGSSIGIAMFPQHGNTTESLIKRADMAMYQSKQDRTGYAVAQ